MGILLMAAMLAMGWLLYSELLNRVATEQQEHVQDHARVLADASVDAVLTEDYELLERWVHSSIVGPYYAYAFLAQVDGQILVHTNQNRIASYIPPVAFTDNINSQSITYQNNDVIEVMSPVKVGDRIIASAHIAYYPGDFPTYFDDIIVKVLLLIIGFLVLLMVITLLILRYFTRPLVRLTDVITRTQNLDVTHQQLDQSIAMRNDEIGVLARAFDSMILRLQDSFFQLQNEEEHLKRRVAERTRELERMNTELESFSYTVSHDLRAPLRSILGFTQALIEENSAHLDEQGGDYLRRIKKACERMGHLIDDLLTLSRVSRSEITFTDVNMSLLAFKYVENLGDSHGREIDWVIAENLIARGDAGLLEVLIENLLANAFKYTSKKEHASIEFNVKEVDGEKVFYVKDNGCGFDSQFDEKLFTPFGRLHNEDEFIGTGIGLATVERIIQRHLGRVWGESQLGQGAIFSFTLNPDSQVMPF